MKNKEIPVLINVSGAVICLDYAIPNGLKSISKCVPCTVPIRMHVYVRLHVIYANVVIFGLFQAKIKFIYYYKYYECVRAATVWCIPCSFFVIICLIFHRTLLCIPSCSLAAIIQLLYFHRITSRLTCYVYECIVRSKNRK